MSNDQIPVSVHVMGSAAAQIAPWKARLEAKARETAAVFANEFPGEALDPAATDWDGEAWAMDRRELERDAEQEEIDWLRESGWKVYQKALVAETKRLAAEK